MSDPPQQLGYGQDDHQRCHERWDIDFMHIENLPRLVWPLNRVKYKRFCLRREGLKIRSTARFRVRAAWRLVA